MIHLAKPSVVWFPKQTKYFEFIKLIRLVQNLKKILDFLLEIMTSLALRNASFLKKTYIGLIYWITADVFIQLLQTIVGKNQSNCI